MKRLLILLLGVFAAFAAAYAIPKEDVKKPVKEFVEYLISDDVTAVTIDVMATERTVIILQVGFSPGDGEIMNPISPINRLIANNHFNAAPERRRAQERTKMRQALFWRPQRT